MICHTLLYNSRDIGVADELICELPVEYIGSSIFTRQTKENSNNLEGNLVTELQQEQEAFSKNVNRRCSSPTSNTRENQTEELRLSVSNERLDSAVRKLPRFTEI